MIGDDRKSSKSDDVSAWEAGDEQHGPTREEIAQRAYERFLARSASAEDDWYAAERELREAGKRAQQTEAQHPEQVTISSPPPNQGRGSPEAPRPGMEKLESAKAGAAKKSAVAKRLAKPARKPGAKG